MNKKSIFKSIFILFVCVLLCAPKTFAWFADKKENALEITASSITAYFAGGTGTSDDPYIITHPIHVYNFAWLQNRGIFNADDKQNHFKLGNDVDMRGDLAGTTNETGAIPPIGNDQFPFYGHFDGDGKVISNLWISSNPEEWREKPENYDHTQTYSKTGFFGKIDKDEQGVYGEATNFVLENVEVTSNVNSSIGLIAGYTNGVISRAGVKNGCITIDGSASSPKDVQSYSVLIGELGPDVKVIDLPGSSGGNQLIINPAKDGVPTGTVAQVTNSNPQTAYYVGQRATESFGRKANHFINREISADWMTATTVDPTDSSICTTEVIATKGEDATPTASNTNQTMYDQIFAPSVSGNMSNISFNSQPTFGSLTNVPELGMSVPANCIWFRPQSFGYCYFVMSCTNMKADIRLSIYTYDRQTNASGTDTLTNIKQLVFNPKALQNNKHLYVFKFMIPQEALGREFVIGRSTNSNNASAGFCYLILPGTGTDLGDDTTVKIPQLTRVDYAELVNGSYDIFAENYTQKMVALSFNQEDVNSLNKLYVNTQTSSQILVNYNSNLLTDGINPSTTVGRRDTKSSSDPNFTDLFPEREKTLPNA